MNTFVRKKTAPKLTGFDSSSRRVQSCSFCVHHQKSGEEEVKVDREKRMCTIVCNQNRNKLLSNFFTQINVNIVVSKD